MLLPRWVGNTGGHVYEFVIHQYQDHSRHEGEPAEDHVGKAYVGGDMEKWHAEDEYKHHSKHGIDHVEDTVYAPGKFIGNKAEEVRNPEYAGTGIGKSYQERNEEKHIKILRHGAHQECKGGEEGKYNNGFGDGHTVQNLPYHKA